MHTNERCGAGVPLGRRTMRIIEASQVRHIVVSLEHDFPFTNSGDID
jgi:hypothetical protein